MCLLAGEPVVFTGGEVAELHGQNGVIGRAAHTGARQPAAAQVGHDWRCRTYPDAGRCCSRGGTARGVLDYRAGAAESSEITGRGEDRRGADRVGPAIEVTSSVRRSSSRTATMCVSASANPRVVCCHSARARPARPSAPWRWDMTPAWVSQRGEQRQGDPHVGPGFCASGEVRVVPRP